MQLIKLATCQFLSKGIIVSEMNYNVSMGTLNPTTVLYLSKGKDEDAMVLQM